MPVVKGFWANRKRDTVEFPRLHHMQSARSVCKVVHAVGGVRREECATWCTRVCLSAVGRGCRKVWFDGNRPGKARHGAFSDRSRPELGWHGDGNPESQPRSGRL